MQILHVTGTYLPSINGVAITVANFKKELEKLGHTVTVLAPDNPKAKKEERIIRYPSIDSPLFKDYPIPLFPGLRTIVKLLNGVKPDVVHVHHPFHIGYFARLLAKHYKVPLVFTYHTNYDTYAEKYLEFLPKDVKVHFLENRVNDFCKKCDLIISPSQHTTVSLKKMLKGKDIVKIQSPVTDLAFANNSKQDLRKEFKLPKDKKILLCVSRLSPEKDLQLLIESMQYMSSDHLLVIVGGGGEGKKLKDLTHKLKLSKQVIFTGPVMHKFVYKYYQAADYFYYSSKSETQGLIYLEAITYGLPVVAVDSAAAREWIEKDWGVLMKSAAKDLAKGVALIEKKDYGKMSTSAKQFAEKFTSDKLIAKLVTAYTNAVKTNKKNKS